MLDFISQDVREYMEQNHLEFTDFEKAALIYHAGFPVLERLERLEKLAENTEDAALREQILARLASYRQDMEAFWNSTEGYVYAVETYEDEREPYICGYFATADMAYAHGMKQGCKFEIEKYLIVGFQDREVKKPKCYRGSPEAGAHYDKDGTLKYFWSAETDRTDEERLSSSFDPARFENAFIFVPNPFERGDIVKLAKDREAHGVVATSQQEWKEFLEQVKTRKANIVDFVDASITVDFLQDDGSISHSHINPVFLEKFEPQKEDLDYDVLMAASAVHQGASLDFFALFLNKYQKQLEEIAAHKSNNWRPLWPQE